MVDTLVSVTFLGIAGGIGILLIWNVSAWLVERKREKARRGQKERSH